MDTQKHKIFEIDPQKLYNLLHRKITVKMGKKLEQTGWVQTIDPVSESIILVNFPEEEDKNVKINFIPGYNVRSIETHEDIASPQLIYQLDSLFCKQQEYVDDKTIESRREALCVWLSDNRVPYSVKNDLSIEVLQAAIIQAPYAVENIECTNEIVLDKVMKLVQALPSGPS